MAVAMFVCFVTSPSNSLVNETKINKKGQPLRVKDTYIWRALQGLSTEDVYLHHSANAEDTILAGRSAASPRAPPTDLCRGYCD